MKRVLLLLIAFVFTNASYAQSSIKPADLVKAYHAKYQTHQLSPFTPTAQRSLNLPSELKDFQTLDLNQEKLNELIQRNEQFIELSFPFKDQDIQVELVEVDILRGVDYVVLQPSGKEVKVNTGKHYRGIIKGDYNSLVAISIFEDEVSGFISGSRYHDLEIGKLEDNSAHIIYETEDLIHHYDLDCATPDDAVDYTPQELNYESITRSENCVELYIEVDYDIYQGKGGTTGASNFVTGFMNQVITMYANENISCTLNPLYIWNSSSPYSGSQSSTLLSQFQNYRSDWDGTLAGLVSYKASGGIAAGFNGICNSNRDASMSFSSIQSSYSNVPTYSWTVDVVTHEFGHIFGSRHTHACVWNGNNTAIDGCAGYTEGGCSIPGNPSGGGTVMSYCHAAAVGKNLSLGFGTQPGNVIRYNVDNGVCLDSCDGDGGGGDTCEANEITITLTTDNYGSETSWTLTDSDGTTIASGSNLSSATTYTVNECLADGCYTFTINDSYGDGICCNYGSGSYSITYNGSTLASGGEFDSTEETEFCVSGDDSEDNTAPTTPTNLTSSNLTETSVNLSWTASFDSVGVAGYNVFSNGTNIGQVTSTNANVTGLSAGSSYTFYVNAFDAAGNTSGQSNSVTVTTPIEEEEITYCELRGVNAAYEWIDYVALNNMTNSSGSDGGYEDYTHLVANASYGNNTVYVSAGFSGSSYREYWNIWIDLNQDGEFTSSERLASGSSTSSGTLSASINIPGSALTGSTRMRVAMKYNNASSASCGTFTYGEVEDYTVVINGAEQHNLTSNHIDAEEMDNEIVTDYKIYPNPLVQQTFRVDLTDVEHTDYRIINSLGEVIQTGSISARDNEITLDQADRGIYLIEFSDGVKTELRKLIKH